MKDAIWSKKINAAAQSTLRKSAPELCASSKTLTITTQASRRSYGRSTRKSRGRRKSISKGKSQLPKLKRMPFKRRRTMRRRQGEQSKRKPRPPLPIRKQPIWLTNRASGSSHNFVQKRLLAAIMIGSGSKLTNANCSRPKTWLRLTVLT